MAQKNITEEFGLGDIVDKGVQYVIRRIEVAHSGGKFEPGDAHNIFHYLHIGANMRLLERRSAGERVKANPLPESLNYVGVRDFYLGKRSH